MNPKLKAALAYLPMVLFSLAGHFGGADLVGWLALAAAVSTVAIVGAQHREGIDPVAVVAAGILLVFAGIALLAGPAGRAWVGTYGFITLHLIIGVGMLVSAVTVPFTERVARVSVPREYWGSATFKAVNRRLSAAWGLAVLLAGLSRVVWLALEPAPGVAPTGPGGLMLNWGIPVLLIYAAVRYTKRTTDAHRHLQASVTAPPAGSPQG